MYVYIYIYMYMYIHTYIHVCARRVVVLPLSVNDLSRVACTFFVLVFINRLCLCARCLSGLHMFVSPNNWR